MSNLATNKAICTNPVVIAGVFIHQDVDGRFSLNDLHKASGGEDKNKPANWLRADKTFELIQEILNAQIRAFRPVESRKGRYGGTYVCKELVYSYAMWISAAFALKVIRAYDALVSGDVEKAQQVAETTVDDRTPLRGIVNRIMGKYGMTYQAVYKLVHKEFGVKHIDELSAKQTAEAVEYLAGKVIEGEWMPKQSLEVKADFSDDIHNINVACAHLDCIYEVWKKELHPSLNKMGSPLASKLYDRIIDAYAIVNMTRNSLESKTGIKGMMQLK